MVVHCAFAPPPSQEILENLRSQILAPIPPQALSSLRGLADQMEKILLLALENYGSTFVEPKVELGARFGHLVCEYRLPTTSLYLGLQTYEY